MRAALILAVLALGACRAEPLLRSVTYAGARFDVVEVSLERYRLGIFRRPDGARLADAPGRVRTNAGIFEPGFRPTGLLVEGGVERFPLNARAGTGNFYLEPNGVFAIRNGAAVIEETSRYSPRGVQLATQSGPLLVEGGRIHPAFLPDATSRKIRSAVGVRDPSHVVFVLSRAPVTFFALAHLFRDELHCPDALYLDGTISGLWVEGASDADELKKGPFAAVLFVEDKKEARSR